MTINGGTFVPDSGSISGAVALSGASLGSGTLSAAAAVTMSNGGLAGGASLTNQGTLTILPGTTTFNGASSNAAEPLCGSRPTIRAGRPA